MVNTHERSVAARQTGLFVEEHGRHGMTVGDLRKLSKGEKEDLVRGVSKFSATLRNTPSFYNNRRQELQSMCAQLGDPHVFATTSHADTYCPYLHTFIKNWACIPEGDDEDPDVDGTVRVSDERDPSSTRPLTKNERYQRRFNNLIKYPHVVAAFFHWKMQLFIERIGKDIIGVNAWWMRYECACHCIDVTSLCVVSLRPVSST